MWWLCQVSFYLRYSISSELNKYVILSVTLEMFLYGTPYLLVAASTGFLWQHIPLLPRVEWRWCLSITGLWGHVDGVACDQLNLTSWSLQYRVSGLETRGRLGNVLGETHYRRSCHSYNHLLMKNSPLFARAEPYNFEMHNDLFVLICLI